VAPARTKWSVFLSVPEMTAVRKGMCRGVRLTIGRGNKKGLKEALAVGVKS